MQTQKTVYDKLKITPLGGGQEVGKSCLLLQFKERNIILDCGIAVGCLQFIQYRRLFKTLVVHYVIVYVYVQVLKGLVRCQRLT